MFYEISCYASVLFVLCRGGGMVDALRSGRSGLMPVWVQVPPSAQYALVAQLDRAQPCGG